MTVPVRVTLSPELSAAVRYLHEHLEPKPTITGLVETALNEMINRRGEAAKLGFADIVWEGARRRSHIQLVKDDK